MSIIKRFERNTAGRDFAVGDIHGHFTRLQSALDAVCFDPNRDRLFSVGDLVDRGPESGLVLDWLAKPWFHAVLGNHEQMTIDSHCDGDADLHFMNGGAWFYALNSDERAAVADALADIPLVIEIETVKGVVGLVHADCPHREWSTMIDALSVEGSEAEHVAAACIWSRRRIQSEDASGVAGVRAVVVGHTPLRHPVALGNVHYIDTAAWNGGHFTLLDLHSLQAHPPAPQKLEWEPAA